MKARKGFIATSFAVLFALLLGMVAMYAVGLGVQTTKEEARMTEEMEHSLYPIAWSTANFVLESLRDAYNNPTAPGSQAVADTFLRGSLSNTPVSTDVVTLAVPVGDAGSLFWVSCDVRVDGVVGTTTALRVKSRAYAAKYSSIEVKGFLSPDVSGLGGYTIIWR